MNNMIKKLKFQIRNENIMVAIMREFSNKTK